MDKYRGASCDSAPRDFLVLPLVTQMGMQGDLQKSRNQIWGFLAPPQYLAIYREQGKEGTHLLPCSLPLPVSLSAILIRPHIRQSSILDGNDEPDQPRSYFRVAEVGYAYGLTSRQKWIGYLHSAEMRCLHLLATIGKTTVRLA
jgi:hypothetical protein